MTAGRVVPPLADPVALLGAAMRYTDVVLGRITVDDLTSPTPCADWNLQELLAHMHESLVVLDEVALDRAVVLRPAAEPVVAERDRVAKEAFDNGDDSNERVYRAPPTKVVRRRKE